jgi:hypothetical protein
MTLTPFDIPTPNADDPRSVVPMFPHRMAQATRDDAALQAIRDRLNREARHRTVRPSPVDRVADWLERTFADRLGWFIATLFPLCVAAFAVGYFGLRELLAGFGL